MWYVLYAYMRVSMYVCVFFYVSNLYVCITCALMYSQFNVQGCKRTAPFSFRAKKEEVSTQDILDILYQGITEHCDVSTCSSIARSFVTRAA